MRNRIIYSIVILPILVALARARTRPYFATTHTYDVLSTVPIEHTIVIIATILLSVVTLLTATHLMRLLETPKEAYFVLLLSPPVLAAAILNPFALVLALAAVLAVTYKDSVFATLFLLIACYIHPAAAILAATLACYQAYTARYKHATITTILAAAIAIVSPSTFTFATQFAELQVPGAISIISILLGVLGIILLWDENVAIPLLITSIPLLAGLVFSELSLVSALVSAVLAGHALRILRKRQWQLSAVKTATTYFIVLGLLFAATASTSQAITTQPQADVIETAEFTMQLTQEPVSVLSSQQNVLAWYGLPIEDGKILLQARTSDDIKELANTYILIEEEYEAPRLRFLLENSRSYIQVQEGQHDLWRYTQ